MTPAHLTLNPNPGVCGFCGCTQQAHFVLVSGGTQQLKCCEFCADTGLRADESAVRFGWRGNVNSVSEFARTEE